MHVIKDLDSRYAIVLGYAASEDSECVYDNEEEARRQNNGEAPLVGFVIFDKVTNDWAKFAQEWYAECDDAIKAYMNAIETSMATRPVLRLSDDLAVILLPAEDGDLEAGSGSILLGFYNLKSEDFVFEDERFSTCSKTLEFYKNVILNSSSEPESEYEEEDESWIITDFRGPYAYMSNGFDQADHPISFAGHQFRTAEGAFQGQKNPEFAHCFVNLTAQEARRLGNNIPLRPDWDDVREHVMADVLFNKFSQDEHLRKALLSTGSAKIMPYNMRHDNFWGSCQCAKCAGKEKKNKLGEILMCIRDTLRDLQN